jgi:cytochrome c oxidase assembly factor CtaG
MPSAAVGLIPLLLIVAADVWVYLDARSRQGTGREVSATVISLDIDTPNAWLLWCVVLFLVFFPVYLVARRATA